MKKLIYFCCTITAIGSLALWSCKKETLKATLNDTKPLGLAVITPLQINPFDSPDIVVSNGMLFFTDYPTFMATYDKLNELEADDNEVHNAYQELNYLENGELPDEKFITCHPILEKFENTRNFTALRKQEEDRETNYLKNGGQLENYVDGFVEDPTFAALLNTSNEVRIGDYIFKYLPNYQIAIISNADFTTLDLVRATPLQNLRDGHHLRLWDRKLGIYSSTKELNLFTVNEQGETIDFANRSVCRPLIDFNIQVSSNNNTITLINTSFDICCDPESNFIWDFGDGTTYTGENPPAHTYTNLTFPLTIRLTAKECQLGLNGLQDVAVIKTFTSPCDMIIKNAAVNVTGNQVSTSTVNLAGSTITWDFGDGTILNGAYQSHIYPFVGTNNKTITLKVIGSDGCTQTFVFIVASGCGYKSGKVLQSFPIPPLNTNNTYVMTCKLNFNSLFLTNSIKVSTKTWIKPWNSVKLIPKFVTSITTSIRGNSNFLYVTQNGGNPLCNSQPVNLLGTDITKTKNNTFYVSFSHKLSVNGAARFDDNQIFSRHNVNTQNTNNPQNLILVN